MVRLLSIDIASVIVFITLIAHNNNMTMILGKEEKVVSVHNKNDNNVEGKDGRHLILDIEMVGPDRHRSNSFSRSISGSYSKKSSKKSSKKRNRKGGHYNYDSYDSRDHSHDSHDSRDHDDDDDDDDVYKTIPTMHPTCHHPTYHSHHHPHHHLYPLYSPICVPSSHPTPQPIVFPPRQPIVFPPRKPGPPIIFPNAIEEQPTSSSNNTHSSYCYSTIITLSIASLLMIFLVR